MKQDLGRQVKSELKNIKEISQRIISKPACLDQLDHSPLVSVVVPHAKVPKDSRVVTPLNPRHSVVAADIVKEVRTDRIPDDIGQHEIFRLYLAAPHPIVDLIVILASAYCFEHLSNWFI